MPNPTRARAAQYLVDPFVPTRDTLPCEHCGTTLSNCDWFPDHLGRLSPRCPNAHRHGTGWRAHPEPKPIPEPLTSCADCGTEIEQPPIGQPRTRCGPCLKKRDAARWRRRRSAVRGEARISTSGLVNESFPSGK